jgi:hypothetical protein
MLKWNSEKANRRKKLNIILETNSNKDLLKITP